MSCFIEPRNTARPGPAAAAEGRRLLACVLVALLATPVPIAAAVPSPPQATAFPYRQSGLDERQAAAHLLDRFTFGARPGDVDRVVETGLERWFEQQLAGSLPEPALDRQLGRFDALGLAVEEMTETFPPPGLVQRMLRGDGDAAMAAPDDEPSADAPSADQRSRVADYYRRYGLRPQRELVRQLQAQKVVRAVLAENQLHEVLTDFWFNHFNVSTSDNQARGYVLAYERDAIRPHVAGTFRDLLEATAKHPAMLLFLDNARSRAAEGQSTALDLDAMGRRGRERAASRRGRSVDPALAARRPTGLNENYARELLELHTLGVDGGYSQEDVIEVARAFSGWSVPPPRRNAQERGRFLELARSGRGGFELEGGFLFNPVWHDSEQKRVLGTTLPAGRGIEDGEQVLDLLAAHPATARHLARKLAVRFVSDDPSTVLVERLAAVFERSGGDVAEMLRAIVRSPEFWSARGEKIKSPLELVASAVRAVGGDLVRPGGLVRAVAQIGEPLYAYQAPTGYPDRADFWVNTGALLQRMSFGLELAASSLPGVSVDLSRILAGREPASVEEALERFAAVVMPERDLSAALERLQPMARAQELRSRLERESAGQPVAGTVEPMAAFAGSDPEEAGAADEMAAPERPAADEPGIGAAPAPLQLAQALGVLLGSPEFQRR